jgi:hypothetical protein
VLCRDPAPPGHELWAESQAAGITNGPAKGEMNWHRDLNSNIAGCLCVSPSEHTFQVPFGLPVRGLFHLIFDTSASGRRLPRALLVGILAVLKFGTLNRRGRCLRGP